MPGLCPAPCRTAATLLLFTLALYAGEHQFRSPAGVTEVCVSGTRFPGAVYSAADDQQEKAYCALDFYSSSLALCPKMWSTSPATIIYDISRGKFPNDPAAFERSACPQGGPARRSAAGEPAIFKMSVNAPDTSGTFAPASLLYYHLSRYFRTEVHVPVAVFRSIDKQAHLRRVTQPGLRYTAGRNSLRMVHAGWRHIEQASGPHPAPAAAAELLTAGGAQLFGVLLNEKGQRYGPEINGTRTGGWGAGQNRAFQRTAPFLALRDARPLREAIREGLRASNLTPAPGDAQMVFWMRELTEIALLDYILGQQDRIGNIDFLEFWYWTRDGKIDRRPASGSRVPPDLVPLRPVRIRRSWLNDNDAGVRSSYSDFARITHMLDGLRHFSAVTYRQLIALDRDLQSQGERHAHLRASYHLADREFQLIVRRTHEAAELLRTACRDGRIRFDLEPREFLLNGSVKEVRPGCDQP